jgi:hypothetical protein
MPAKIDRRLREERLGFRVDEPTKALIERAAQLERRSRMPLGGRLRSMKRSSCRTGIARCSSMLSSAHRRPASGSSGPLRSISAGSCREWQNGHRRTFGSCCSGRRTTVAALPAG